MQVLEAIRIQIENLGLNPKAEPSAISSTKPPLPIGAVLAFDSL
jgi:hypothetical protein